MVQRRSAERRAAARRLGGRSGKAAEDRRSQLVIDIADGTGCLLFGFGCGVHPSLGRSSAWERTILRVARGMTVVVMLTTALSGITAGQEAEQTRRTDEARDVRAFKGDGSAVKPPYGAARDEFSQ